MKQYLLFDLDGTLTDPMVGITSSVQYALEKFGIHVRYLKELIPFIGPPLQNHFRNFMGFRKRMRRRQYNITENIMRRREYLKMKFMRVFRRCLRI